MVWDSKVTVLETAMKRSPGGGQGWLVKTILVWPSSDQLIETEEGNSGSLSRSSVAVEQQFTWYTWKRMMMCYHWFRCDGWIVTIHCFFFYFVWLCTLIVEIILIEQVLCRKLKSNLPLLSRSRPLGWYYKTCLNYIWKKYFACELFVM